MSSSLPAPVPPFRPWVFGVGLAVPPGRPPALRHARRAGRALSEALTDRFGLSPGSVNVMWDTSSAPCQRAGWQVRWVDGPDPAAMAEGALSVVTLSSPLAVALVQGEVAFQRIVSLRAWALALADAHLRGEPVPHLDDPAVHGAWRAMLGLAAYPDRGHAEPADRLASLLVAASRTLSESCYPEVELAEALREFGPDGLAALVAASDAVHWVG